MLTSNAAKLDELAMELATNYCTASFGESEKKQVKLSDIFSPKCKALPDGHRTSNEPPTIDDISQHRNILLIGAGATYDSYKCIPLGDQVIEKLREKYEAKIGDFPAIREKYKSSINEQKIQNRPLDFENYLALFVELILTPEQLRKELADLYTYKYSPSLLYEIIAHMFKHSFIDVIVNFNFDELLDRAIDEEVGKNNYYHVVSDGDAVSIDDVTVDGRLKIPVYIKPHGTITHKTSLRFTKQDYLNVPESIKHLLQQLISGKRGEIDTEKKVKDLTQVNIISVGFNMASIEFNDILNKFLPDRSKIFHFAYGKKDIRDPHFVKEILPDFYKRAFGAWQPERGSADLSLDEFDNYVYKRISIESMDKAEVDDTLTSPYSKLFSCLWRKMHRQFKEHLQPRSIGSHELVAYLFCDPDFFTDEMHLIKEDVVNRYENNIHYFLDRTLVEIAITINRNNGVVDIADLLNERAGFYYAEYRRIHLEQKRSPKDLLSIYDLINQFTDDASEEESKATLLRNIFRLKVLNFEETIEEIKQLRTATDSRGIRHPRLKKWELPFYDQLSDSTSPGRIPSDLKNKTNPQEFINVALERFERLLTGYYGGKCYIPVTIMYHLFRCSLLSDQFTENLKKNYGKAVYNQKNYDSKKDKLFLEPGQKSPLLIDELIRLFLKSSTGHFFTIKPKFNDHANFLTQSFSKNKILHTNLSVEYAFLNMMGKDWDIALLIIENGNILKLLEENQDLLLRTNRKRKIIVINSYEALRQLHPDEEFGKIELIKRRNKEYTDFVAKGQPGSLVEFSTLSTPAVQHNHHMMLFLKRSPSTAERRPSACYIFTNTTGQKIPVEMVGGIYMFRRGFSSSINPIFIGDTSYSPFTDTKALTNDLRKLLSMFLINFCRAIAFEKSSNPFVDSPNGIAAESYQDWDSHTTLVELHKFIGLLIDEESKSDAYN